MKLKAKNYSSRKEIIAVKESKGIFTPSWNKSDSDCDDSIVLVYVPVYSIRNMYCMCRNVTGDEPFELKLKKIRGRREDKEFILQAENSPHSE